LGYEFIVLSKFTSKVLRGQKNQECINYQITLEKGTKPEMLLKNIHTVAAEICIKNELNDTRQFIHYRASVIEGPDKNRFFFLLY